MNNAVEYLKANADVYMLLQYYNTQSISRSGRDIRCCCPIHRGNNSTAFVFNTSRNLWFCHTGCQEGGDIYDLVMKMESVSFEESVQRVATILNIDISEMEITLRADSLVRETKQWIETMKMLFCKEKVKSFDISILGKLYTLNSYRHFDKETLGYFDIKYCELNKRIVVPIYANDILIGVTMRRTTNHPAKWLHQPSGLVTGNHLYNLNNIKKGEEIILVEGVWDALSYWQTGYENVVASFGCHLSEEQERLILRNTYDLIVSYDSDIAGICGTNNIIERMKHKINIKIASIPQGKDAGELNNKEIINAIQNSKSIKEWRV